MEGIAPFRIGSLVTGDVVFYRLVFPPFSGKILAVGDELACAMYVQGGVIGTVSVVAIGVVPGVHPGLLMWCDCDPRIVSSTKVSSVWS